MTAPQFDRLTQQLATTQTRRSVLGRLAAVFGVVAMAFAASIAPAGASSVKMACARAGQLCGAAQTDPNRPTVCCPHLVCGVDGKCVAE